MRAVRSRRARVEAMSSSDAPPENIKPTISPASSSPRASEPTIATSAIVSTPKWWSTITVCATSRASSMARRTTAARQTSSPVLPAPSRCNRPPTASASRAMAARTGARCSITASSHRERERPSCLLREALFARTGSVDMNEGSRATSARSSVAPHRLSFPYFAAWRVRTSAGRPGTRRATPVAGSGARLDFRGSSSARTSSVNGLLEVVRENAETRAGA